MNLIFGIILLLLALAGIVAQKTYYYLPLRELKRQAEKQDPLASKLYAAVAYGNSLRGLLAVFIALTSGGGFVLLSRAVPSWLGVIVLTTLLLIAYWFLPATRVTSVGARITKLVTPLVIRILNYAHPVMRRTVDVAVRRYGAPDHTGLYERADLLQIIERQQAQSDSRVSTEELEIAKRALSFGDYSVADVLTPRAQIKTVIASDTLGPILIDELHQSGQTIVLVHETRKGPPVGSLQVERLGLSSKGKVQDSMNTALYYMHESDSLHEALHAFFVTNQPLFIVVNSFEEYIGVITIESVLRQLLGHVPGDDFEQYTDRAAVAARHNPPADSSDDDEKVLE